MFLGSVYQSVDDSDVWLHSELGSALVRILSQPPPEHPEHGGERSGSSWQGAAAAPGGLWHHLPGNCRTNRLTWNTPVMLTLTMHLYTCPSSTCGRCWRPCSQKFLLVRSGSGSSTTSSPTIHPSCSWPAWLTSPAAGSLCCSAPRKRTLR